jgi:hypothetical protein
LKAVAVVLSIKIMKMRVVYIAGIEKYHNAVFVDAHGLLLVKAVVIG